VSNFYDGPTVRLNDESLAAIETAKGMQHRLEALEAEVERRTTGIAERMVQMSECLIELKTMQLVAIARVQRLERAFLDLWIMQEACAGRSASDPHCAAQSCIAYNVARNHLDPIASAMANDLADTDRNQQPKE